jgi:F1F0 ATPase subunit 2
MSVMYEVVLGLLTGAVLSAIFLGGLALTVRRLPGSSHPGLLVVASFAVRAAVVVAVFVLLAQESLLAFAIGFAVFVLARLVTVWLGARTPTAVAGD